jgi:hypothetical protein
MEASAGVIHRAFAFTSSAVAHSTRNDNGPAVFDHACQSGIEAIVSKRLDPQCRLDRQRFGSKIRAKPCAVRKTGIRERLRYCWRSGRGRMPGGIASKAKGRPCQRLRLWHEPGWGCGLPCCAPLNDAVNDSEAGVLTKTYYAGRLADRLILTIVMRYRPLVGGHHSKIAPINPCTAPTR